MNKIWKETWKKGSEGSVQAKSKSGLDSDQVEAQSSGTSTAVRTSPGAAAAAPPNTGKPLLVSVEPHGPPKRKHPRTLDIADHPDHLAKRPRRGDDLGRDSLANRLPETVQDENSESQTSRLDAEDVQVLEQAKEQNTIGVVPVRSVTNILFQFLTWAVDVERSRPTRALSRPHRPALSVVDTALDVEAHASDLELHTDLTIGKYTDPADIVDQHRWSQLLKHDVVVIPVHSLLASLHRGSLAITQIHALVMIGSQFVQDQSLDHLVRVMNEFYHVTDLLSRPRILALVASSTPRKFQYDSGMLELEIALDAKVSGVSTERRTEILSIPDTPSETVILYNPAPRTTVTRLTEELLKLDPGEVMVPHHFRASRLVLAQLGSCASDLVWRKAVGRIEATIHPSHRMLDDSVDQSDMSDPNARMRICDAIQNWALEMPKLNPNSRGFNVTPKFLKLIQILRSYESYGEEFRGIVFVQRRITALLISDLLDTLADYVPFISSCAVVGHGLTVEQQHQATFRAFGQGSYNLLIATKSKEDLDIPKACVVILFDLFESYISNAYVRARTRGRESHLVFMMERGDDNHRRILSQLTHPEPQVRSWMESVARSRGSGIPPSGLREISDPYTSDSDAEHDENEDTLLDPTSSGKIRPQDATKVVYRFAARQGVSRGSDPVPLFEFEELAVSRAYVCTVRLPPPNLYPISGPPALSPSLARRKACFATCVDLFRRGLLDYTLFPLPQGPPPQGIAFQEDSEHMEVENKQIGTRQYLRKQPDFWTNVISVPLGGPLYPTIIYTRHYDEYSRLHGPLVILTRRPLPSFASFKLFFSGVPAILRLVQGAPFQVDDRRLRDIHMYTIRICRAISNRALICPLEKMPYFVIPLAASWKEPPRDGKDLQSIVEHIPWDLVSLAAKTWVLPLKTESTEALRQDIEDAAIQDRWVEFTRRYDALQLRTDLTPLSKPLDSPREAAYENFVEYCKVRRKDFDGLKDYSQPLIEVVKVPALLNRLNPTSVPSAAPTRYPAKYLIPELCAKFTIPASTFRMALLLPSITRRIDDLLVMKELNAKLFDHAIVERHLHPALSAPSLGIEYDYERLELLGDAFLKYLSSVYVFVSNPTQHEGELHVARQSIISNKALLHCASRVGLPMFIQAKTFAVRTWQPLNWTVLPNTGPSAPAAEIQSPMDEEHAIPIDGGGDEESPIEGKQAQSIGSSTEKPLSDLTKHGVPTMTTLDLAQPRVSQPPEVAKRPKRPKKRRPNESQNYYQSLGDKAVADVAEAIIGAAYISGGREGALKACRALQLPVPYVACWSDFGRKAMAPPPAVSAQLRPGSVEAVEKIIGHKLARPHLLAQALTHASVQGHEMTSYERLEFIGDAILDFMVIRHIFDRDKQLSPGGLTLLKGAMVSNSALAAICVWSGLQEHLLFDSLALASSMQSYADELKARQAKEYKLAEEEGRSPGQYWVDMDPPKALSDVVESIIGAIYISDDFSPAGAEALFDNILKPFYDSHITLKTLSHHPTKILFELFQAQGCQSFEIVKEKDEAAQIARCDVLVHGVVLASATDTAMSGAARQASFCALDALGGDAAFLMRTCDCRSQTKKLSKKSLDKEDAAKEEYDDVRMKD